jgi:hypothetical protein
MKAIVKQNGKAVRVNSVVIWPYGRNIMVSIDTKEKWPELLGGVSGGDYEFRFDFIVPESCYKKGKKNCFDPKKHITSVTLTPTTKVERKLFKNGFFLEHSKRYGRTYVLTPKFVRTPRHKVIFGK